MSRIKSIFIAAVLIVTLSSLALAYRAAMQVPEPTIEPRIVNPGSAGGPPSDAIVLFDGKDLSAWKSVRDGGAAKWALKDGAVEVVRGTGDIQTKQEFGDVQLHIEWATPSEVKGEGQGRGNSGVFLQGRYEVQVLDSFNNKTYFHGQAASVYKQYPPLVNATRAPGEWQTYDIIFRAPHFDESGKVLKKATVTVLHNGVLVQDHSEIMGTTTHEPVQPTYSKHGKAPLRLQDHGDPVRFRNIWIREL